MLRSFIAVARTRRRTGFSVFNIVRARHGVIWLGQSTEYNTKVGNKLQRKKKYNREK
jgi:hypothetical protein